MLFFVFCFGYCGCENVTFEMHQIYIDPFEQSGYDSLPHLVRESDEALDEIGIEMKMKVNFFSPQNF